MRCALLFGLLVLVSAAALADEASKPIGLKGVPGVVTPPAGDWTQRNESLVPGQWYVEYRARNGQALLRAHVFPARAGSEPEPTLTQAIDRFFRGLGVDGFGVPTRRPVDVWGCAGAEGTIMAAVAGERVNGNARIVRLTEHHWGFAIGYATEKAEAAQRAAVKAFVSGLEPARPVFYERRFHDPAAFDGVAVRVPGGDALTAAQIAAVVRVIEAGIEERFPLALAAPIRAAMRADARKGTTRTRQGYRDTEQALRAAIDFERAKREASLKRLGTRILDAILKRANGGYEPAVKFALAFREGRAMRAGTVEDGLTANALANRMEMSEFLASLAADRDVRIEGERRLDLVKRVDAGWKDLPEAERDGWRRIGALWSALRFAWDRAKPEARFAFRRAVVARLGAAEGRAAVEALADERALKQHMMARPQAGLEARLAEAAFALSLADRRSLVDALGVEDAHGFHFGW